MGRIRPVVLLLAISLSLCTANQRCVDAGKQLQSWTIMLVVVPTLINIISIGVMLFTVLYIKRLKALSESVTSNINWLSRTAVNVGIGPTAKKAIQEYAMRKPETARFVQAPSKE